MARLGSSMTGAFEVRATWRQPPPGASMDGAQLCHSCERSNSMLVTSTSANASAAILFASNFASQQHDHPLGLTPASYPRPRASR